MTVAVAFWPVVANLLVVAVERSEHVDLSQGEPENDGDGEQPSGGDHEQSAEKDAARFDRVQGVPAPGNEPERECTQSTDDDRGDLQSVEKRSRDRDGREQSGYQEE